MKAEHETMAGTTARQHDDTADIFDDDAPFIGEVGTLGDDEPDDSGALAPDEFESDARQSYLEELSYDWHAIRAARAEARSRGEHLPLTPFQLRIGREYTRIQTQLHRERRSEPQSGSRRASSVLPAPARASVIPSGARDHTRRAVPLTPPAHSDAASQNPAKGNAASGADFQPAYGVEQSSSLAGGQQGSGPASVPISRTQARNALKHQRRLEKTRLRAAQKAAKQAAQSAARRAQPNPQPPAYASSSRPIAPNSGSPSNTLAGGPSGGAGLFRGGG